MPIPHGLLGQTFFLVVTLGMAMPLFPDDREQEIRDAQLRVIVPDRETTAILDRVAQVIEAANDENLDDFAKGFIPSRQAAIRWEAGLFFVQHELAIELTDCHMLICAEDTAEVAVNYLTTLEQGDVRVISVLILRRTDNDWHIESERVVRRTVVKDGCANGACGGPEPAIGGFCIGGQCQVR